MTADPDSAWAIPAPVGSVEVGFAAVAPASVGSVKDRFAAHRPVTTRADRSVRLAGDVCSRTSSGSLRSRLGGASAGARLH